MYEELEVLGEGTVGLVKRCTRKSDDKEFAVKIVRTNDEEIIMMVHQAIAKLARS